MVYSGRYCSVCRQRKRASTFSQGSLVFRWDEPAAAPVRTRTDHEITCGDGGREAGSNAGLRVFNSAVERRRQSGDSGR